MMNKKMIRVICIILAVLMALSCVAVLTQVFALESTVMPVTGDDDMRFIIPIAIAVVAVIAVVLCLVLPKLKKKDADK